MDKKKERERIIPKPMKRKEMTESERETMREGRNGYYSKGWMRKQPDLRDADYQKRKNAGGMSEE
jgi:hypothetical protein